MSHPYSAHRQTAKEHSRVGHITKGYASGGAVNRTEDDRKVRKMSVSQEREVNPEGGVSPHRMDRPKRAKGGRVGHKGNAKTVINVITGGADKAAPPPMPMGIAGPPPGAMPPPVAAKPPMMPPPGPPPGGPPMPMRARGGAVKSKGMNVGTKVSHSNGKSDLPDMNRKRVVTFKAGGAVKSFTVRADGGSVDIKPVGPTGRERIGPDGKVSGFARGGRVESPNGVAKATMLPGGGGGGEARLAKAHRAARKG